MNYLKNMLIISFALALFCIGFSKDENEKIIQQLKSAQPDQRIKAIDTLEKKKHPNIVTLLQPLLIYDKDPSVRHTAVWALGNTVKDSYWKSDPNKAIELLAIVLAEDAHPGIRKAAAWALAFIEVEKKDTTKKVESILFSRWQRERNFDVRKTIGMALMGTSMRVD